MGEWTGPKQVDGKKTEDFWRSHEVPLSGMHGNPEHIKVLEDWLKSYKPEELFDDNGTLLPELKELAPTGNHRISATLYSNGGLLRKDLKMPDFREYGVEVDKPGAVEAENPRPLGVFLRDVIANNMNSFRVFGPDETASNRLNAI